MYKQFNNLGKNNHSDDFSDYLLIDIEDLNHRNKLLDSYDLICIKYYANWCQPCKNILSLYKKLAKKYNKIGKCLLCQENIDLQINSSDKLPKYIPYFYIYLNKKLVYKIDNINKLNELLNDLINNN